MMMKIEKAIFRGVMSLLACTLLLFSCEKEQVIPAIGDNRSLLNPAEMHIDPLGSSAENAGPGARFFAADDPNLNASWDWRTSTRQTMYYSPDGTSANSQMIQTTLPFFAQGSILSTTEKDMQPNDGWMLAYKDFGTEAHPVKYPFFALYNKYRGTLRFMFYNAPNDQGTYYRLELAFNEAQHAEAIMTFNNGGTLSSPNLGDHKEAARTVMQQYGGWGVADFTLAGYDPSISTASQLRLTIYRIMVTTTNLIPTELNIFDFIENTSPTGLSLERGGNIVKDVGSMNDFMRSVANFTPSSYVDVVDYVKNGLGFKSKNFIGGRDKMSFRSSININRQTTLDGNLITESPIWEYVLKVSDTGWTNDGTSYPPLNSIPWGLFNFDKLPEIQYNLDLSAFPAPDGCQYDAQSSVTAVNDASIQVNPNSGMTLQSIRYKLLATYDTDQSESQNWVNSLQEYVGTSRSSTSMINFEDNLYGEIGVELVFRINTPTSYLDDEVIIYQTFPVGEIANTRYSYECF